MKTDLRLTMKPEDYINYLFENTKDNKLSIMYYPEIESPYSLTSQLDWSESDKNDLIKKYKSLETMIIKFAQLSNELDDSVNRNQLLSQEELEVYESYIIPFEPFEASERVIHDLYIRGEYDQLDDEENELLERHYNWRANESLKRLPFIRKNPMDVILRARRLERLVYWKAPEIVINEEKCWLAEEMMHYHFDIKEDDLDAI